MKLLPLSALLLLGAAAAAQEKTTSPYKSQRAEEDWSFLRESAADSSDPFRALKFLALSPDRGAWLSLGGDLRWRYERYENPLWGAAPEDGNGYWLQRYFLHADLHLGERLRVFGQLMRSSEDGRRGGPRPLDRDDADVNQLFAEISAPLADGELQVRAGRQELAYGSSRLISIRESPNVRQTFDGVKAIYRTHGWQFDALWMRPVEIDPHEFDNQSHDAEQLWGIYATGPVWSVLGLSTDLYYLGLKRDDAEYFQGTANEVRHSFGARLFGKSSGWDYNFEGVVQFGKFGDDDIRAWTVASDTGFTFARTPWKPRLGLKANITSGDDDPNDHRLGTFNALFPRGAYFNELALIGPFNHTDLSPSLTLRPAALLTFTTSANFFWRTETHDAVYNNGGGIARAPGDSSARYVGSALQTQLDWQVTANVSCTAVWGHFFSGEYLRNTGPAKDVDYVSAWVSFRL
jgi:hypothetical protein